MKVITFASHLLLGRHFLLNTDARNLTFISSDSTKKIYRWFLQLLPFHFTINHIPGKDNIMADQLSRMQQMNSLHREVDCDHPYSRNITVGSIELDISVDDE